MIITIDKRETTTRSGITFIFGTSVVIITFNRGMRTSFGVITFIFSTGVTITTVYMLGGASNFRITSIR
jgi:hypothetical protein